MRDVEVDRESLDLEDLAGLVLSNGERLLLTVGGRGIAAVVPAAEGAALEQREGTASLGAGTPREKLERDFRELLSPDDPLDRELREADTEPRDPFA